MAILKRLYVSAVLAITILVLISGARHQASFAQLGDEAELTNIIQRSQTNLQLSDLERNWLAEHPVVRVGIDADFEPYSFADEDGFDGIVPDYLSVLEGLLNVRFQAVSGLSWSDIIERAQSREIDMIATAARLKERESYLTFSDFLLPTPIVIMTRENQKAEFSDPSDLAGRKMALVHGYAAGKRARQDYPDAIAMMYDTPRDALIAVASGEADAYIGVLATNAYLVRKHGLGNLVVASRYGNNVDGQRFAIRDDWDILRSAIDKALAAVSTQDHSLLVKSWAPNLEIPNYKPTKLVIGAREQAFIASGKPVRMCVDPDWMPYERIDANGKHVGIAADYIEMFADTLGIKVELVPTESWAQSEEYAQARKCDILSMLNKSERRSEFLNFTDPYIIAPIVIVAHQSAPYIDGLESLSGKTFAMVKGYVYEDILKQQYPSIELVYVENMDEALRKVSSGEIYATMGSLYIISTQVQKLGLSDVKIAGHTELTNEFRVGVRNDDPIMLSLFQKAVLQADEQRESEILRKWVAVNIEQPFDYDLLWKVLAVFGVILAFVAYRHVTIRNYNRQLREKNVEFERQSRTDALTGCANRLKLNEVIADAEKSAKQDGSNLSLILFDIDGFKPINDRHGHLVGDDVLIAVVAAVRLICRDGDTFGRWGGEEFMIVCPNTAVDVAKEMAETCRQAIADISVGEVKQVTASFGVTGCRGDDGANAMVRRADNALYQAKENGRDCVVVG